MVVKTEFLASKLVTAIQSNCKNCGQDSSSQNHLHFKLYTDSTSAINRLQESLWINPERSIVQTSH